MTNPSMLLHVCCGPCTAFPLQFLRRLPENFSITGYYFNPNIHPYKEFLRRRDALQTFAQRSELDLVIDENYTLENFLRAALDAPDDRCRMCYELRLREAARYAKSHGFDCFSTTLLVSPYQKHDVIRQTGQQAAEEEGVPFNYYDFRPGWQEGVRISREMELYRQPYCGCIFSEKERYYKIRKEQS